MSGIRRAVMNETSKYPKFLIQVVWVKYNACTYLKLSDIFEFYDGSWKKFKDYIFMPDDPACSAKVCMKTQQSIIVTTQDNTYFNTHIAVSDTVGRRSEMYFPIICGDNHLLNIVGSVEPGTEFMFSELVSMDEYYNNFSFQDSVILSASTDDDAHYTDKLFEIKSDRLRIIGNVEYGNVYALVDNIHKRAMVFHIISAT